MSLLLILGVLGGSTQASHAESRVADCLELKFPTSSIGSSIITLTAEVYAICNSTQLGRGNGQRPLYSVAEESSLLSLSSCSGPSATYRTTYGSGWIGNVTCTFPISQNFFGSQRTGATSSTIRMWFAWDFSEKSIGVSHSAIPYSCPTISCSTGGTSGGTSGGGGTIFPTPTQSCAPPNAPTLTYTYNDNGVLFSATPATTGAQANSLLWSYAHYDIAGKVWGPWTKWATVSPAKAFTFQADKTDGKSRVVFSVYASSLCGDSEQARESESKTGILFVPITTARFIDIKPGTNNGKVRANGDTPAEFTIVVTDNSGMGVGKISLEVVVAGVGKLTDGNTKAILTTDAKGEVVIQLKSESSGETSVTAKSLTLGQFAEIAGVVGGVVTSGAKPGTYSVTGYVTFGISEAAELINNEALDAANEALDAADAASEMDSSETVAAVNAADRVMLETQNVDILISELKLQIQRLSTLIQKVQERIRK